MEILGMDVPVTHSYWYQTNINGKIWDELHCEGSGKYFDGFKEDIQRIPYDRSRSLKENVPIMSAYIRNMSTDELKSIINNVAHFSRASSIFLMMPAFSGRKNYRKKFKYYVDRFSHIDETYYDSFCDLLLTRYSGIYEDVAEDLLNAYRFAGRLILRCNVYITGCKMLTTHTIETKESNL